MNKILMKPFSKALIVESPHKVLDQSLREVGIEPIRYDTIPNERALIDAIHATGAEVLFKRSRIPVTQEVIDACPQLYAVQLCSIGTDSVDLQACANAGVLVFNDPISNGLSVLELTIGHLIALSRRLYETNEHTHRGGWEKEAKGRYEIAGKNLGIIGLGNIGRQVARMCETLGMNISFFDNRPVAQEVGVEMGWIRRDSLEDLFVHADMVTVHTSAFDFEGRSNDGFLDPYLHLLAQKVKDDSPRIFLNLARGNLHSSEALLDAVKAGNIRAAAVDVYPEEPAPGVKNWQNPYAAEPRIVCTPHIGGATAEAQPRIARRVGSTIGLFSRYGSLRDCVFAPRITVEQADHVRGKAFLAVVHSTSRGTKKAVDDTIYRAEVSNLGSMHRDFDIGVAYDLSVIDHPLKYEELTALVEQAKTLANDSNAIRSVRQVVVPAKGW